MRPCSAKGAPRVDDGVPHDRACEAPRAPGAEPRGDVVDGCGAPMSCARDLFGVTAEEGGVLFSVGTLGICEHTFAAAHSSARARSASPAMPRESMAPFPPDDQP